MIDARRAPLYPTTRTGLDAGTILDLPFIDEQAKNISTHRRQGVNITDTQTRQDPAGGLNDGRPTPARVALPAGWLALLGPALPSASDTSTPAAGPGRRGNGFRLLWVVLAANASPSCCSRGHACHDRERRGFATMIARRWAPAGVSDRVQGAIIATDLAGFTGIVLSMQLLFHLSMAWSVGIGLAIIGRC